MYQPLSPRLAGPELQGPLGTFPPKRPHSTSSSPSMGSGPVTEAMSRLAPSSPTLWPSRCSGQETREREGGVSPRSCGLRASSSQPCSPLPLSSPGLCSLEQPSPHPAGELECVLENPRCWTGGPLSPASGSRGGGSQEDRRGSGPTSGGAAGWLPSPLHPRTPTAAPGGPGGMEEGGEPAWRTGHPLGRTQDARPEVPSPSQGHEGKRSLGPGSHQF